jgi:hypothetical protein
MTSYIYFCRAANADQVNALLEEEGYGPDCISVDLVNTVDLTQWKGAHSFVELDVSAPYLQQTVVSSSYAGGEPIDNWNTALADNNLEQPEITQPPLEV